jgi:hypothetical protein
LQDTYTEFDAADISGTPKHGARRLPSEARKQLQVISPPLLDVLLQAAGTAQADQRAAAALMALLGREKPGSSNCYQSLDERSGTALGLTLHARRWPLLQHLYTYSLTCNRVRKAPWMQANMLAVRLLDLEISRVCTPSPVASNAAFVCLFEDPTEDLLQVCHRMQAACMTGYITDGLDAASADAGSGIHRFLTTPWPSTKAGLFQEELPGGLGNPLHYVSRFYSPHPPEVDGQPLHLQQPYRQVLTPSQIRTMPVAAVGKLTCDLLEFKDGAFAAGTDGWQRTPTFYASTHAGLTALLDCNATQVSCDTLLCAASPTVLHMAIDSMRHPPTQPSMWQLGFASTCPAHDLQLLELSHICWHKHVTQ